MSLAAGWALAAGCVTPLGLDRDEDAPIQTRALEYTLTPRFGRPHVRITYTFRNPAPHEVYILKCLDPEVALQQRRQGSWVRVDRVGSFACLGVPIEVGPGEKWVDQIRFSAPDCAFDCDHFPTVESPVATYRLVLEGVVDSYDAVTGARGELLPVEKRVSNRFRIRLPDPSVGEGRRPGSGYSSSQR